MLESPETRSEDVVLSVRGLCTEYRTNEGPVKAVRDVSFDVRRAGKLAIVGESGSGKSALALSILGLMEPPGRIVGGEVWLNGRELLRLDDRELSSVRGNEISLVYQDPMSALDPVKTIGHQIMEAVVQHRSMSYKDARARAVSLLQEVEVPHADRRLDDYPHQYSGGMRQRVMIAIALANEPDLVIADEPTTALDVTTQAQVIALLDRLVSERQAAIMLITHNLGIVAEFCDDVSVMYAGRLVESTSVDNAFNRSVHPYTESLLKAVVRADRLTEGELPAIPGAPPDLAALPTGCSFEPRCPVGRGLEACRTVAPPVVAVGPDGRRTLGECHFAAERWARHVGEPVAGRGNEVTS
jgi:oligopeptide/dipeptide ABC transporter ATP-binding protein